MTAEPRRRGPRRLLRREPTQARSRALVESVLVALDQLLRTVSDERELTIERLVERAGVGIGSFYEYFTNKDSLLGVLVERATRDNFQQLLATFDAQPRPDIESAVRALARLVAETYLAHPARTRMLLAGIGRLNLTKVVNAERDRFATELATRMGPLLPGLAHDEVVAVSIESCDAAIGVIVGHLYRGPQPIDRVADQLAVIVLAIIAARVRASARE